MRKLTLLVGLAALLCLAGCDFFQKSAKEVVVAECYGSYLYASDLKGIVPEGSNPYDSLQRVNDFIDSWIMRRILIHQAENNLNKEELDLKKQLDEYRNSLVLYAYETQLINQKLDTVVSEDEIEAYYEQNKANFQLRNTMVQAVYVILKEDCEQKEDIEKLMSDPDTLLLQNLDILATYYAEKSYLDVDNWMRLDELIRIIPIEILNPEYFFKKNRFVTFDVDDLTYMVRFENYLLEESISPLVMERDHIRSIILAQRRKQLIERMKEATYKTAQREHAFTKYVGPPVLESDK